MRIPLVSSGTMMVAWARTRRTGPRESMCAPRTCWASVIWRERRRRVGMKRSAVVHTNTSGFGSRRVRIRVVKRSAGVVASSAAVEHSIVTSRSTRTEAYPIPPGVKAAKPKTRASTGTIGARRPQSPRIPRTRTRAPAVSAASPRWARGLEVRKVAVTAAVSATSFERTSKPFPRVVASPERSGPAVSGTGAVSVTVREAWRAARGRSWVIMTIVVPSRFRSASSPISASVPCQSRPVVGSSRIRTSGFIARAEATASRCRSPRPSRSGCSPAKSPSPTRSRARPARTATSGSGSPALRGPKAASSKTVFAKI